MIRWTIKYVLFQFCLATLHCFQHNFKHVFSLAVLFQYPGADLIIIGDYPSDSRTKLDFDPKIKSKLVKAPTPSATASQAFLAQWKCTHEGEKKIFF
jgi:hypothetical protein